MHNIKYAFNTLCERMSSAVPIHSIPAINFFSYDISLYISLLRVCVTNRSLSFIFKSESVTGNSILQNKVNAFYKTILFETL